MSSVTHLPQHTNTAQTPLPVDWYISPEIFAAEQLLVFANTPKYDLCGSEIINAISQVGLCVTAA
jgi:hypothetical protein